MSTNGDREPARAQAEIQETMDEANRLTQKVSDLSDRLTDVENSRDAFDTQGEWEAAVEVVERQLEDVQEEEREAQSSFERTLAYWNEDDEYPDEDED
jgi:predicted  nucleic acid-binding Zn-ribbon protein